MKFHFRPFLGLTIFTVISLAILIALGTWQYQRLQWKTALLADVEQAVTAPPLRSLGSLETALAINAPVDFRRIEFDAEIMVGQQPYLVYSPQKRELMWRKYMVVKDSISGDRVYAALDLVSDSNRDSAGEMTATPPQNFAGYIRLWRSPERGSTKSTPEMNRWFGFDPLRQRAPWSRGQGDEYADDLIDTRFYVDVVMGETSAENLPIKRPEIRNNHLDYMLTWYGLAVALFVIYLILHVQRGRLGFRKS